MKKKVYRLAIISAFVVTSTAAMACGSWACRLGIDSGPHCICVVAK